MSITKNTFSIGGNELHTKTSADMVTYGGSSTVKQKLDEILDPSGGGTFIQKLLKANSPDAVRNLLRIYPQTFFDEAGYSWTASGAPILDSSNFKFGNASAYFNGSSVITRDLTIFWDANQPFTIDCWLNGSFTGAMQDPVRIATSTSDYLEIRFGAASGNFSVHDYLGGSKKFEYVYNPISYNTWFHAEYGFDGSTAYFFIDGQLLSSAACTHPAQSGRVLLLGGLSISRPYTGYIDEFRFSDICRHTSSFIPPSEPYLIDEHTIDLLHFNEE